MDRDFWLGMWERGRIPFHWHVANPLLVEYFPALGLAAGARVFLPLCGKTVDIGWLRARGFRVAGAELSARAVEELFDQMGEAPEVTVEGPLRRFRARDVEIFQGDIFDLTAGRLGPVDATYDRAALIALPPGLRRRYAAHLTEITAGAPQLLLGLTGLPDPDRGPPFQVDGEEIRHLYGAAYRIAALGVSPDPERSGGVDEVWLMTR